MPDMKEEVEHETGKSVAIAKYFWNRCFPTPVGDFCFDENGQRQVPMEVVMLNATTGLFSRRIFLRAMDSFILQVEEEVNWVSGSRWPVLDKPACGFSGTEGPCTNGDSGLTTVQMNAVVFTVILSLFVLLIIVRHYASKKSTRDLGWDLMPQRFQVVNFGASYSKADRLLDRFDTWRDNKNSTPRRALYDEYIVWTKAVLVSGQKLRSGRNFLSYINELRNFHHPNVVKFFGLLRRPKDTLFVTEWCSRGDVRSFLEHSTHIYIDWDIRYSLIRDLLQGVAAIHQSFIRYHGSLTPSACLVNSHLNLKLAKAGYREVLRLGYGLENIEEDLISKYRKDKVFFSPEYVATEFQLWSSQSDIYAMGQLIFLIQKDAEQPNTGEPVFDLDKFVTWCCAYDPEDRPTSHEFPEALTRPNDYNVVTKMLRRVELYAEELENAVLARTSELEQEQQKCDALLLQMLPTNVAIRLRQGETIDPEHFSSVTLSFSDVSGFLEFVAHVPALKVMRFLDETHKLFDRVIADFDVYKVETIGDTYFLASGVPYPNRVMHASEVCKCVLNMRYDFSQRFPIQKLQLRTGVHSGSCVAGEFLLLDRKRIHRWPPTIAIKIPSSSPTVLF
ncbi:hypothetical protein RvY_01179-2 [Ramazzottius varieornatus]|uniref:guanylate cyclase n=1 Tax=Ramazzottius varieornatus TaxID=947166 RepID=A0A1D1UFE2_RAMVA|nr:hypothetical protein RvY_01179-2 [Ramazzottius varieornatus]